MKVPFSWLKEFVDIDVTPQELENKLFDCGFEVEELIEIGKDIQNVVVGYVKECTPIPDTHLHVCIVDAGTGEDLQICCGADNVCAGGKYPVALEGASVYATAKDHKTIEGTMKIKKGKLKGYDSFGMLCSGVELGLNDDLYPGSDYCGLLVLPEDSPIGTDIKSIVGLDDYLFDISITANRADCQSVLGIAREVAAALNKPLKMPNINYSTSNELIDGLNVSVEAPDLCPRYLAHAVKNIKIEQSPAWMRKNLALCGLRSISNIVDITNYVMLEIGQPMHAFDMDSLESKQIVVRRAKNDETIVTLDEKEFKLNENNLLICDGCKAVALAGVMGGLNSEITDNTTNLLFESAKFLRDNIRKTARSLGQNTDSSSHFEKGISEYSVELGLARALHLIEELKCGEITASHFDCSAGASREGKKFKASFSGINKILGIDVPKEDVLEILKKLNFEVSVNDDLMEVIAPRYREDIEIGEPDLAEEIIREYGYQHIVPTFLKSAAVTNGGLTLKQQHTNKVKRIFCSEGYYEISTLAFYSDSDLNALHLDSSAEEMNAIHILNPISSNLTTMRTILVPSILNTVVENLKRGNASGRIFELGNIYQPKQLPVMELPNEIPHIGFACFGSDEDFFTIKGTVESLANNLGLHFDYKRSNNISYLHPGMSADILCNNVTIGSFGKLANEITKELDLPKDSKNNYQIYIGEINFELLESFVPDVVRYQNISDFPDATRDLSLIVDESVECGSIINEIKNACKQVNEVNLFDIYRGEQIGENKKSMSFNITFSATDRLLEPKDLDKFIKKILGNLKYKLNIEIR